MSVVKQEPVSGEVHQVSHVKRHIIGGPVKNKEVICHRCIRSSNFFNNPNIKQNNVCNTSKRKGHFASSKFCNNQSQSMYKVDDARINNENNDSEANLSTIEIYLLLLESLIGS